MPPVVQSMIQKVQEQVAAHAAKGAKAASLERMNDLERDDVAIMLQLDAPRRRLVEQEMERAGGDKPKEETLGAATSGDKKNAFGIDPVPTHPRPHTPLQHPHTHPAAHTSPPACPRRLAD